jgi:hypothetical protein
MTLANYILCRPEQADAKCRNCKRWTDQNAKHINSVNLKNSKSKACIYIPISLQEKV